MNTTSIRTLPWFALMIGAVGGAHIAEAKPSVGRDHDSSGEHLYVFKTLAKAPPGEFPARSSWAPLDEQRAVDKDSEETTISLGKRRLSIELVQDGGDRKVHVTDGRRELYDIAEGSPSFAYSWDGFHVLFAGNSHEAYAYDLSNGKKLASIDDLVFSPDGTFALSPPPFEASGCANRSRVFRIPLDGSAKPYAIDTAPMKKEVLCTEEGAVPRGNFREYVAISPKGHYYAVLSRDELGLYDSKNDSLLASYDAPPYDARDGGHNEISFATKGKYLVIAHENDGNHLERSWFSWSEAKPKSRRRS
jgi:hypothetical protein